MVEDISMSGESMNSCGVVDNSSATASSDGMAEETSTSGHFIKSSSKPEDDAEIPDIGVLEKDTFSRRCEETPIGEQQSGMYKNKYLCLLI